MSTTLPRNRLLACLALLTFACLTPTLAAQGSGEIEQRTYYFEEAERDQEYALYVPKSYSEKKASPLVVLLHGLNSNPRQVMRYEGITKEAGERGYIVVAPYGYNGRGWYGSRGKGKKGAFFGRRSDPDNLGELSEKDVLNVLEIVRKEYEVDDNRIYLMGHSMGGAGTLYLGSTYPDIWAGLAPLAPAVDRSTSRLKTMQHVPVHMVTGDKDRMVKVGSVRLWAEAMKELEMDHQYVEIAGGDHVRSITSNPKMIGKVFDFFDGKQKPKAKGKKADREKAGAGR